MSAAAPKTVTRFTSAWRLAGLTYIDNITAASNALRRVLKEPQRSESMARANFKYREFTYSEDKEHPPSAYSASPRRPDASVTLLGQLLTRPIAILPRMHLTPLPPRHFSLLIDDYAAEFYSDPSMAKMK
jgi:hypothetical protein